ncbi:hypothetical protein WJR50_13890 [Catalinimonas sp. 4WD22]
MIKFKIAFFIGISVIVQACVQEVETGINQPCPTSCIQIRGQFTTEDGTVGISGLPVKLRWGVYGMFNGKSRTIASSSTDDNGYYDFSFTPQEEELEKGTFTVNFDPSSEYYAEENYFELFNLNQKDTTVIRNYHIPLKARLKIVITNPEQFTATDYLHCSVSYQFDAPEHKAFKVSGALDTRYNNQNEFTFDAAGNQYTYVDILKKKDGLLESIKDSVLVAPAQELVYELHF